MQGVSLSTCASNDTQKILRNVLICFCRPNIKHTLRFSKFRTFFSTTWRAWPRGPSPQRVVSAAEVAMDVVEDTCTMLPELETFEEMRDADGMLLMLAMEQYTQERILIN